MESRDGGSERKVKPWNTLGAMLGAGVVAFTCAAGALVWGIVANLAEREFTQQETNQARTISTIIARDLGEHMLAGGGAKVWAEISTEARQYVEMAGALRLLAMNANGTVKAASDSAAVGTRIEVRGNPDCPGCDWSGTFPASSIATDANGTARLRVVNSIPTSQACLGCHTALETARGFILVDFDLSPLKRAGEMRNRIILGLGLGATVVLLALLTFLLRRLVIRPVTKLEQAMDRLAAGNLSERAVVAVNNEIGVLAGHFNVMAGSLESAHTESTLLYKLVVEASKKLEMTDFAKNLCSVIQDNLLPQQSIFILETSSGGYTCAISGETGEPVMVAGDDPLEDALARESAIMHQLQSHSAPTLLAEAYRTQKLQTLAEPQGLSFALPVVSEARLLGVLYCCAIPARILVSKDLLQNLGVHLMLAANNSRHYTGAITDGLTRLGNKQYGLVRLEEAVFASKRYHTDLVLAMCDIDFFKKVNDSYGHLAGDAVLREVARRIKDSMRKADTAVRYGGEEFMLIIPQISIDSLAKIGEKIRTCVSATPIKLGRGLQPIQVTMSVGLAAYDAKTDSGQALIARADAALYRAKQGGRDRVEVDY